MSRAVVALAMSTGIAVREWAPELADDPRVLETAFALTLEKPNDG